VNDDPNVGFPRIADASIMNATERIPLLFLVAGLESQVQDSKDLYWF